MISPEFRRLFAAVGLVALVATLSFGGVSRAMPSVSAFQVATPTTTGACATPTNGSGMSGNMMGGSMMGGSPAAGMPMHAEFDLMFIDMMIAHHQSAVVMSGIAIDRSEHQEIRDLAQTIVTTQQAEIAQMQVWRDAWYPGAAAMPMNQMTETMFGMMNSMPMTMATPGGMPSMGGMMGTMDPLGAADALCVSSGPFDEAFLRMMVAHHESAVAMAQVALGSATHPEIQQLARTMIDTQQAEIVLMQGWQATWFAAASPASSPVANQVDVTLTEFAVKSSLITFQVGVTYHFVVTNAGSIPHEFMILPRMEGTGALDMETLDKMALVMIPADDLLPGTTLSADVTFTEAAPTGALELVCAVPGHYDAGMKLPITVTA